MKILQFTAALFFMLLSITVSAQDYRLEGNEVKLTAAIKFKAGSAELLPESDAALLIIKKYLADKTYITLLRVEAHTGNDGNAETNQLLSQKRAAGICQELIALGVTCDRLLPVGFGSSKPIAGNDTADGLAQNNRISFVNAELKGKAIGGMPTDGGGKVAENPCY